MSPELKPFRKIQLDPQNRVYADIMSNGKTYQVPRFQRDYAWEQPHWDELWTDITAMREQRVQHFMGYLVFQTDDGKCFRVIDGQQRLTTLSLILIAGLSRLDTLAEQGEAVEDNRNRIAAYRKAYLDVDNLLNLRTSPKLILNRHNKKHFRIISQSLNIHIQRNMIKTNRQINQGLLYFQEKFKACTSGNQIVEIINDIADGLLFTIITVENDLNAYTVFETLNARGLHLSTPDLLKNYFLSRIEEQDIYAEQDFDEFDEDWANILYQLGNTGFTNFLYHHIGISEKTPHKSHLYRTLQIKIDQADKVLPYLDSLKQYASVYAALQSPHDNFWKENDGQYHEIRHYLEILTLFNIRTPLSVLMIGYTRLSPTEFIKLTKRISALTIRYNVICGKPSRDQERIYNKMANKLFHDKASLYDITQDMLTIYPDDDTFRHAFTEKSLPSRQSNKKIMYLLRAIEAYISEQEPPLNLTLEHVLPYTADDAWQASFGRDSYISATDRLGNMALLPKKQNMGQEPFTEKQTRLRDSPYRINQHIAEYDSWNIEHVHDHQKWLAKQATAVWRIAS
ncbi:MAG: DUF262 domain-containing HNH endonuclease family protein [Pseudomonadota bacterium]